MNRLYEDRHWAWIRYPFLEFAPAQHGLRGHHGRLIVHGHSIVGVVDQTSIDEQVARYRLNLDLGSYMTGRVAMAHIHDRQADLYIAAGPAADRS